MFKKRPSDLDKIIKGIIIGGAIGSAIGVTLAPKSGKDTRSFLGGTLKSITSWRPWKKKKLEPVPVEEKKKKPLVFRLMRGGYLLIKGKKK